MGKNDTARRAKSAAPGSVGSFAVHSSPDNASSDDAGEHIMDLLFKQARAAVDAKAEKELKAEVGVAKKTVDKICGEQANLMKEHRNQMQELYKRIMEEVQAADDNIADIATEMNQVIVKAEALNKKLITGVENLIEARQNNAVNTLEGFAKSCVDQREFPSAHTNGELGLCFLPANAVEDQAMEDGSGSEGDDEGEESEASDSDAGLRIIKDNTDGHKREEDDDEDEDSDDEDEEMD